MTRRLLVTGFGPFPGVRANPSAALVRLLAADRRLARQRAAVTPHLFATTYAAVDADIGALAASGPVAVLMLGVAARRKGLSVERFARNRLAQFPDASGKRPGAPVIAKGGPIALHGRAPMLRAVAAGRGHGLRVTPSMSAGTYLCNYAYWRMLRALPPQTPCLFVHVPKLSCRRLAAAADALRAIALVLLSSAASAPAAADHPG